VLRQTFLQFHHAVNYAADIAVTTTAELLLLHVVQIPVTVIEVPLTEWNAGKRQKMHRNNWLNSSITYQCVQKIK
jgi:hypothetical protein